MPEVLAMLKWRLVPQRLVGGGNGPWGATGTLRSKWGRLENPLGGNPTLVNYGNLIPYIKVHDEVLYNLRLTFRAAWLGER